MIGWWLTVLVACSGGEATAPTDGETKDAPAPDAGKAKKGKGKAGKGKAKPPEVEKVPAKIWLLDKAAFAEGREPYLVAVDREVGAKAPQKNAVWTLFQGPTAEESAKGLELVKSGAEGFEDLTIEGGVATLKLRGGCASEGSTVTVYDLIRETLLQFEDVQHVKLLDPEGNTTRPEGTEDSRPECLEP